MGSIGTSGGTLIVGNKADHSGVNFGYRNLFPMIGGSSNDGAVSIGSSTGRFKDLYLSGGVYLGGTGSANKLDDYEEGTWTPVVRGTVSDPTLTIVTANTGGIYTKIGDMVFVSFEVRWTNKSGGSGDVYISGLPFTRNSTNNPDGDRSTFDSYNVTYPSGSIAPIANAGRNNTIVGLGFTRSGAP